MERSIRLALLLSAGLCAATPTPSPTNPPRTYPFARADQDWSFLEDPANRTDPFDSLEYIPLNATHPDWYLSIGAETRQQYESIGNDLWGETPYENSYWLQRYQFITDFHFGERYRAFFELKSNTESGRIGGPRPFDDAWLDFLGAFMQVQFGPSASSTTARAGREELSLGSGRLVSPREGPNVRQSFTGEDVRGNAGAFHLQAIQMDLDIDAPQPFAAVPTNGTTLWGLYASTQPTAFRPEVDVYDLGIYRQYYTIARGTGAESRGTVGVRLTQPCQLQRTGLDYDDEAMYQFGRFAAKPILAYALFTQTGWHFGPSPRSPHLLLKADIVSGDPGQNTVGTFDPYFPIGNYFDVFLTTGPGEANVVDIHPALSTVLGKFSITGQWLWYWRQNVNDGLYGEGGQFLRGPSHSLARFVGESPGVEVYWQIDAHFYAQGDYGIFTAGPFIKESGPASTLVYRSILAGYKF